MTAFDGVSIEVAADLLNMSHEAMKARVKRAEREISEFGEEIDLGHGVTGFKPNFQKAWIIYIPRKTLTVVEKNKKRRGPPALTRTKVKKRGSHG
jgi:hypothetical protein